MGALSIENERRGHQRYTAHIEVNIRAANGMSSGLLVGTSLEGLRVSTPKRIKPAMDVVVYFSDDEDVTILASVVWVLDKVKKGLTSYLTGLQIHSITMGGREIQGMAERTAFFQDLRI